jgi:hypothetical protein
MKAAVMTLEDHGTSRDKLLLPKASEPWSTAGMSAKTLQLLWPEELEAVSPPATKWIWQGYLAAGCVTLLTSQWKSGKTTLLSLLLSKRVHGGSLAGLTVLSGKTAVVSEEDAAHWNERRRRLDFGRHSCFLCRPFRSKPTGAEWAALLETLEAQCRQESLDLVVLDTLASFLPSGAESSVDLIMDTLMPLVSLAKLGTAVLLLHHPTKGSPPEGQAARGSGALSGFADIVLEMSYVGPPSAADRRRRLVGLSRFGETTRRLLVQLNETGTDYECLSDDFSDSEFLTNWAHVEKMLEGAKDKLTRKQLLADWLDGQQKPTDMTLWRWLDRAHSLNMVARDGAGCRNTPFRYWLPHKMEEWKKDPLYEIFHFEPPQEPPFPGTPWP